MSINHVFVNSAQQNTCICNPNTTKFRCYKENPRKVLLMPGVKWLLHTVSANCCFQIAHQAIQSGLQANSGAEFFLAVAGGQGLTQMLSTLLLEQGKSKACRHPTSTSYHTHYTAAKFCILCVPCIGARIGVFVVAV